MCGINGFNFVNKRLIKQMNDSLKHRGPDAEGTFFDEKISLGHRRLAVIDLSKKANQPMSYSHKGKKAIIVYNGEIYNFKEIKEELIKKSYKFNSNSDTEVILASYLEWGTDCVNKFNGMWAFCIYDLNKKILFFSRDRLGQKPLYYFYDNKKFIFSSEIKGILKHKIKKELNQDAIDLYFSLGFIPAPYSIYKDIFKLEAGHNLLFDIEKKIIKKMKYFSPPKYNPIKNKKLLIKKTKQLIKDATKLRLLSDVPLGAFLSGGIDSPTIVHEMTKEIKKKKLHTFSIGFEGKYDESQLIKIVKNLFNTNHYHKYFNEKDFKKELKEIFFYFDEPFADPSMFPTLDLSKFARKKLIVSLSGDGGDEMFGGYPRYQMAAQIELLYKIPKIIRKKILVFTKGKIQEGIRVSLLPKEKIFSESRLKVYKPEIYKSLSEQKMKEMLDLSNGKLTEAIVLYDRYFQTLADNFLTKVDRASMAKSLEVRSPFLDYRFIKLSSKIPTKLKSSIKKNKILLRKIASSFLPTKIIKQKKTGFTPPIEKWLLKKEYKKELKSILEELYHKKIISQKWYEFYKNQAFNKTGVVYQNFLIKLFLFYYWFKYWIKN